MRTLVTGAAGFIGSNLVDRLLAEGHDVVGVDNLSTGTTANLEAALAGKARAAAGFTFIPVDVQAPEMSGIVMGVSPDVIFHLAAHVDLRASVSDPQFDARSNILGTINLCEAARQAGVRRIVYAASGGSRYGTPSRLPVDENHSLTPQSPYAVAKLAGELYLGAYAGMYGLAPICLALSNVYGPRQNPRGEAGVIAVFGGAMVAGDGVTVYGDGSASRDYVYVDDVVEAFVCAAAAPLSVTGTFNIGTGMQTSVMDVFRMLSALFDDVPPAGHAEMRTGELQAIALDAGRAHDQLGWEPVVDIAQGIERTVHWLRGRQDARMAS
ncbi:UDP-glucose 4-epimerase [Mycobacterium sp. MAA66]|uniref:NAD-dependent epimerase/dehydratase family protein n=1 Tax=Mycobacterium sp. MAA66 TaxID=3156297 RepID=UPI0035123BAD